MAGDIYSEFAIAKTIHKRMALASAIVWRWKEFVKGKLPHELVFFGGEKGLFWRSENRKRTFPIIYAQ